MVTTNTLSGPSSTSGGPMAYLAIDERYKGKGLLIDALQPLLAASDRLALPIITIDGKYSA